MSEGDWAYALAKANETIREANAIIAELWKERDEAKAELEEWRRDYDRGTKMSDLSAEVRSEINHWRERAEIAEAEVARLQRENSDLNHNIVGMRSSNTSLVAERDEAKAEIARLTAENQRFKELIKSETAWLRSLNPDPYENSKPGEAWNKAYQPTEDALVKAKAEVDRLRSGITPNVSREYDTGEKPKGMWPDWGDSPNGFDGPGGAE